MAGFGEHLNGLLNRKLTHVLGIGGERNCGMIRPTLLVEPLRRRWDVPRSDISSRLLVHSPLTIPVSAASCLVVGVKTDLGWVDASAGMHGDIS